MTTTKDRKNSDFTGEITFCRYRRVRNSDKILDAHDYGLTAWPIKRRKK